MLPKGTVTIAELLRRSGYSTGMSGKWHLGNTLELSPDNYGFDHAHGFLGPWVDFYTHRSQQEKVTWHRNGAYIEQEGHATDLIADEAIQFITEFRDKDKPFFLYVPFNAPHLPLQEEKRWIEHGMFEGARILGNSNPFVLFHLSKEMQWKRPIPQHLLKAVRSGNWKISERHYIPREEVNHGV